MSLPLGGNSYFSTDIMSSLSSHRRSLCAFRLMARFVLPMDVLIPNMTAIDMEYCSWIPSITFPFTYDLGLLLSLVRFLSMYFRTAFGPLKWKESMSPPPFFLRSDIFLLTLAAFSNAWRCASSSSSVKISSFVSSTSRRLLPGISTTIGSTWTCFLNWTRVGVAPDVSIPSSSLKSSSSIFSFPLSCLRLACLSVSATEISDGMLWLMSVEMRLWKGMG
mmetsp:Transcript_26856/g.57108  ORF Transcript_26856/g.57108 Transcript_26856/m.57108 type:complete len:220 (-) Transcript_26856:438-1097(-)